MINFLRLSGLVLLILVGYHYINESLGFSVAGSIAAALFGICLISLYQGYSFDAGNLIGWSVITLGCLLLAIIDSWSWLILISAVLYILGYRMAGLPFSFPGGWGGSAHDAGIGDSCDFGGGDGGGCD